MSFQKICHWELIQRRIEGHVRTINRLIIVNDKNMETSLLKILTSFLIRVESCIHQTRGIRATPVCRQSSPFNSKNNPYRSTILFDGRSSFLFFSFLILFSVFFFLFFTQSLHGVKLRGVLAICKLAVTIYKSCE